MGVPDGSRPSSFSGYDNGAAVMTIRNYGQDPKAFSMMSLSDRNGHCLISPYGPEQSSLVIAHYHSGEKTALVGIVGNVVAMVTIISLTKLLIIYLKLIKLILFSLVPEEHLCMIYKYISHRPIIALAKLYSLLLGVWSLYSKCTFLEIYICIIN